MEVAEPMMTREEIRLFYDRFGTRQDRQDFYEDAATRDLVAHAGFEEARAVFEFGVERDGLRLAFWHTSSWRALPIPAVM